MRWISSPPVHHLGLLPRQQLEMWTKRTDLTKVIQQVRKYIYVLVFWEAFFSIFFWRVIYYNCGDSIRWSCMWPFVIFMMLQWDDNRLRLLKRTHEMVFSKQMIIPIITKMSRPLVSAAFPIFYLLSQFHVYYAQQTAVHPYVSEHTSDTVIPANGDARGFLLC